MISFVNAKINLGLHVFPRAENGYHPLASIFYPIGKYVGTAEDLILGKGEKPLCDILEVTPSGHDIFRCTGDGADCPPEKNHVMRALQWVRGKFPDKNAPLAITLEKHLPTQAGMGGGSADGVAMLKSLLYLSEPSQELLTEIAYELGADWPFFIFNRPAFVTGIGEKLKPLPSRLSLDGFWAAVVVPSVGVSTGDAFALLDRERPIFPENALAEAINEWQTPEEMLASPLLVNDFERPMFALHPETREIKEALLNHGALYASLTGSGSAFVGIYRTSQQAAEAARIAAPHGVTRYIVRL